MKPDRAVDEVARRQHGVVSRAQAFESGLSEAAIHRRIKEGAWIAITPGVYALASAPASWERQLMAAIVSRPGALVAGASAAYLHGFTGFNQARPVIMTASSANARLTIGRVIRVTDFDAVARLSVRGFRTTTAAETLWTLAPDLGRRRMFDLVDEQILVGRTTVNELDSVLSRVNLRRQRGLKDFRDAVMRTAPESESVAANILEVHLYRLLSSREVPPVSKQHPFSLRGDTARVDAYVADWRMVVEADGRNWHARQSDFQRDRARDNELAAHGIVVVRFTYHDLTSRFDHCLGTVLAVGRHRRAMNTA